MRAAVLRCADATEIGHTKVLLHDFGPCDSDKQAGTILRNVAHSLRNGILVSVFPAHPTGKGPRALCQQRQDGVVGGRRAVLPGKLHVLVRGVVDADVANNSSRHCCNCVRSEPHALVGHLHTGPANNRQVTEDAVCGVGIGELFMSAAVRELLHECARRVHRACVHGTTVMVGSHAPPKVPPS